ncbi:FtsQ-type POTRA domain-containing protein [Zophobihabitans entericus]|uniref:Cell division protein FtsQ n=1 Tax=Zophobihabitans entericus TaxID=1635327 RepID=A0A6G9IB83_9GAMM|nr:FtsQ-type POTRA domain-containing protein [Zophobihabitans entericus]QIQ20974.1 FtsQ-type POTRA domain-containing protein [Zophobihabitans entericus]
MKKSRQAAPKKAPVKKKRLGIFHSLEQCIGLVFFLIVLMVGGWIVYTIVNWMDNPERVVLSQLIVTGEKTYTSDQDIQQAIQSLGLMDTFIGQDVNTIQQEVLRIPWIKQVSVRKQWPDKLILNIVEYKPTMYWNDVFLLDEHATVFSLPAERTQELILPALHGPEGKEVLVLDEYRKLNDILKNNQLKNGLVLVITTISANERYSWQLMVKQCISGNSGDAMLCNDDENIKLVLGREKIEERFKRFIELYPEIQAKTAENERIVAVDLRYNNGISVQRNVLNKITNN